MRDAILHVICLVGHALGGGETEHLLERGLEVAHAPGVESGVPGGVEVGEDDGAVEQAGRHGARRTEAHDGVDGV